MREKSDAGQYLADRASHAVLQSLKTLNRPEVGGAAYAKEAPAVVHEAQSNGVSVTELKFFASGVKAEAADLGRGKRVKFIRIPAGFGSALHAHTQDCYPEIVALA